MSSINLLEDKLKVEWMISGVRLILLINDSKLHIERSIAKLINSDCQSPLSL